VSLWDHSCQKSFEKRVRELPIEAETQVCWRRLLSGWLLNPQNLEVSDFTRFIDCAFKVLSDHLDKVDWICRDNLEIPRSPHHGRIRAGGSEPESRRRNGGAHI
jgi:hypothetical protein